MPSCREVFAKEELQGDDVFSFLLIHSVIGSVLSRPKATCGLAFSAIEIKSSPLRPILLNTITLVFCMEAFRSLTPPGPMVPFPLGTSCSFRRIVNPRTPI